MKAESRNKYKGVKIHLDEKECQSYLDWLTSRKQQGETQIVTSLAVKFAKEIAKTIRDIQVEHPDVLEERTEEQIKEALLRDQKKIVEQLQTMESGADWKAVK